MKYEFYAILKLILHTSYLIFLCLGLRCWSSEVEGYFHLFHILYNTVGSFKTLYVFFDGFHKTFGVHRRKDYSAFYLTLCGTRHHTYKVYNKFRCTVRDDGKICISALSHLFSYLYIQLIGLLLI